MSEYKQEKNYNEQASLPISSQSILVFFYTPFFFDNKSSSFILPFNLFSCPNQFSFLFEFNADEKQTFSIAVK